jgi:hypothetical protein
MLRCDCFFLLLITACLRSLFGCSDRSEPLPIIATPTVLRDWSVQEESELAHALEPYPSSSILWTLHDDWGADEKGNQHQAEAYKIQMRRHNRF